MDEILAVGHRSSLAGAELRPATGAGFLQQQLALGPVVVEGRRGAARFVDDGGHGNPVGVSGRLELAQGRGQDGTADIVAATRAAHFAPRPGLHLTLGPGPTAHVTSPLTNSSSTITYVVTLDK